jgi:hypothetical protein
MICPKISGKGCQTEIRYRNAKNCGLLSSFSGGSGSLFVALVSEVRPDVKNRNRHAITDVARFALPWKQAENA